MKAMGPSSGAKALTVSDGGVPFLPPVTSSAILTWGKRRLEHFESKEN